MATKYLDDTGLSYFWGKAKAFFQEKLVSGTNIKTINNESVLGSGNISISGGTAKTFYGECTDSGSTVAKTVTISNFTSSDLVTGVTITVKFSSNNTATSPTLNVSDTGAIAIKRYGTTAVGTSTNTSWNSGGICELTYDGTNWVLNDHLNTTYSTVTYSSSGLAPAAGGTSATYVVLRKTTGSANPGWGKITASYMSNVSSTPSASYIAQFDASKHMNSEDMSSADVTSFVEALTGNGESLIAKINGQTLTFGNLKMVYVSGTVASASQINLTYPSSFTSTPWLAIPFCAQGGFGASLTASVVACTNTYVTVYQYNNANVSANVGALVIGLV